MKFMSNVYVYFIMTKYKAIYMSMLYNGHLHMHQVYEYLHVYLIIVIYMYIKYRSIFICTRYMTIHIYDH